MEAGVQCLQVRPPNPACRLHLVGFTVSRDFVYSWRGALVDGDGEAEVEAGALSACP